MAEHPPTEEDMLVQKYRLFKWLGVEMYNPNLDAEDMNLYIYLKNLETQSNG